MAIYRYQLSILVLTNPITRISDLQILLLSKAKMGIKGFFKRFYLKKNISSDRMAKMGMWPRLGWLEFGQLS